MFSNDSLIERTFQYFYFIFDYSPFLKLQFNRYKLLLFLRFIIRQVLLFVVLVIIYALFISYLFVCIDQIRIN